MAAALEWSLGNLAVNCRNCSTCAAACSILRTHAAPVLVNGPEDDGLPHALNLSFPGCRGDAHADEPRPGRRRVLDGFGVFERVAACLRPF